MVETSASVIPKRYFDIGVALLQMICVASITTGVIWGSSDYLLLTVLVKSPVTPLSVLMMLYGTVGLFLSELGKRVVNKRFLSQR